MGNWVLKSDNSTLLQWIKEDEGTISYQTAKGYYKNGKFWTYLDSLNLPTIGYGHLILKGENFSNGLTEAQATELLAKDLKQAVSDAKSIYDGAGMSGGEQLQLVLTQMVFQMGKTRVLGFKKAIAAMGKGDYKEAARQMRDSTWYRQTPKRCDRLAKIVESL